VSRRWWLGALALALAGCGGGGKPATVTAQRGVPLFHTVGRGLALTLPGGDDYVLALVSTAGASGSVTAYLNGGGDLLPPLTVTRAAGRRRHRPQVELPPVARAAAARAASRALPAVGSQRTFAVLEGPTREVTATLRASGEHCLLYVDNSTAPGVLTDADLADLRQQFDSSIYPTDTSVFGPASDVDGNGRLIVLFTPTVDPNGFGYFYAGDVMSGYGNNADMFYALVPRPERGDTYASLRTAILATLWHEFQHLINYNNKVLVRFGSDEESWLNEGLSFNAEYVGGLLDTDGGPPERVGRWLSSPESFTLLNRTVPYQHGHAGIGFLFVRWLVERYGQEVLGKLVRSGLTGVANVEAATGHPLATLWPRCAAAVYLTGTGLSNDAQCNLATFNPRGAYEFGGQLHGPGLTPVDAASGTPRAEVAWARGGVRYLRLTGAPAGGLNLALNSTDGDNTVVTVIRIPPSTP